LKIMIADDDKLIRYYTQSLIAEVMNETYDIIEADNGKVLVELCKKMQPDIVFVDIKMPFKDGISAIEEVRSHCPQTNFVVLTAYADFSFAKRCIALGVTDYLLKPIERETLIKILAELKIKIKKENSLDNFKFQHKIISLFNTPMISDRNIMIETQTEHTAFLYFEFFIFCTDYDELHHFIYSRLSNELGDLADNLLKYGSRNVLFHSKSGNLAFVVQSTTQNKRFVINSINIILHSYTDNCSVSCLSSTSTSIAQLIEQAAIIQQKHHCMFAFNSGVVHDIEHVLSQMNTSHLVFLKLFSNMITAYMDRNEPQYTFHINQLLKNTKLHLTQEHFDAMQTFINMITNQQFNYENLKSLCQALLSLSEDMKISLYPSSLDKMDLIKEYIDTNYMHDIGLTTIAEQFHLTPNYLSKLFHDKFAIKFTDYLTQIRIYHSKLLLASSKEISIKTVSSMVGYNSPRYFTNIFFKLNNMYPSDYKKSLK